MQDSGLFPFRFERDFAMLEKDEPANVRMLFPVFSGRNRQVGKNEQPFESEPPPVWT